jgi:predicted CopG family antitoxin
MGKYATISVPADVKKVLEKAKGRHEWGEFLFSLYSEASRLSSRRAFEELTSLLTTEDLESILKTSREFRERLAFRSATNG